MKRYLTLTAFAACMIVAFWGCSPAAPDTPLDPIVPVEPVGPDDEDNPQGPSSDIPEGFEDEPDDMAPDQVKTFDYSILAKAGHPRLLCDAEGFENLKEKVTTGRFKNKTLYKLHSEIVARAREISTTDRGFSAADDHYIILDNLLACAYAYKITGQDVYLAKAKKDMTAVCRLPDWNPGGLSVGEISFGMALAYDWLYYDLDLETRKLAHQMMVAKGIKPMYNKNWSPTIGNWNQINLGGASCASLAVYEKDKAIAVKQLEKAFIENKTAMTGIYSPDGTYAEGLGYWEYGGGFQVCFISALKDIFGSTAGLEEVPGFRESGKYALYMHGTMGMPFSYSDGGGTTDPLLMTSWWFAALHDDPSLIFCEKHRMDQGDYSGTALSSTAFRVLPAILVTLRDFDMERPINPPAEEIWQGDGEMPVCMVRKGWKFDGTDVYLGIKGGHANTWKTSSTAHGHMDAGSFVFEAEGVRWSDDIMRPGYDNWFATLKQHGSRSGDTSQSGLRWDTFRVNPLCHSCIVSYANDGSVPGKLHSTDYYVDGFAPIDKVIDSGGRQGAVVDMTAPMKGQVKSAKRTVELVNGTDLVVTDEITALDGLDCPLEWRMLSVSASSVASDGVTLTKNGKTRRLTVESSTSSVTPQYKAWAAKKPTTDGWGVLNFSQSISERTIAGWSATVPAGKTVKFVTTLKK